MHLNRNGERSIIGLAQTDEEKRLFRDRYGWFSDENYRQSVVQDGSRAIAKPEDFLPFVFRHLSATIVGGGSWKATDFSEGNVLKKAKDLLRHKPNYVNHELQASNIIGVIGDTTWVPEADDVVAGIEAPIWIDGVLHTDLTRKLTGYPVPHIQSVSVSVMYEWKPSHEFLDTEGEFDDWTFEMQIGRMVDGKMVRRIVTKIIDFYESSLVWLGADPFAKIIGLDGKPLNVERSAVVDKKNFDSDPLVTLYKERGSIYLVDDCEREGATVSLREKILTSYSKSGNPDVPPKQVKKDEMEFKKQLALMMGVEEDQVTLDLLKQYKLVKPENLVEKSALTTAEADRDKYKKENDEYCKIVAFDGLAELQKEIALDAVVSFAKLGKEALDKKRSECERLYKLSAKEAEDAAVIGLIQKATSEELDGLLKQYGADAVEEFKPFCTKCDSAEFISTRKSEADGNKGGSFAGKNVPLWRSGAGGGTL